ncbi:hypothetical protein LT330_000801 [Penicillium expansum]|nr:hypothetical protein LT330_000801 [Penicillium expansum]
MSSNSCYCDAPHSWVTDVQDLRKTVPLFVILYILYLMGQLLLGRLRHKQKLKEIHAENETKCICRLREFELHAQIAEVTEREVNSRAEQLRVEPVRRRALPASSRD